MSVGIVDKQTGERIPTAGMPAIDNALDLTSVNPVQNAIITAALANKQDKTDNSLQTTDKTVVGAINEHEGDIDSLKSGLTNFDTEVNGDATVYPYSDVITIEDAVPSNLADCSVKIEPVQSGSGDPSPTNIRPITGHTEVVVTVTDDAESPTVTQTYTIALGDTIYGGTVDFDSGVMTVDRAVVDLGTLTWQKDSSVGHSRYVANNSGMKTSGSVISDVFQSTTYDQVYNNTKDNAIAIHNIYSQFAVHSTYYETDYDATQFGNAMSGHYACYELATPTTIQLTPQQIQLLKGQNTLYASTGQISVTVNGVSGSIGSVQEQLNGLTRAIGWDDTRNIFNGIIRQGYVSNTTGEYVDSASRWVCTTKQECKENTTYTISASSSFLTRKIIVVYFDSNDTLISYNEYDHEASPVKINATITTPSNTAYIAVDIANQRNADGYDITPSDVWNVQVEEGKQTTPYIPYHPVIGTAVEELLEKVPDAPSTDGTYSLQVTVASGVPTYSWVSNA